MKLRIRCKIKLDLLRLWSKLIYKIVYSTKPDVHYLVCPVYCI